MKVRIAVMLLVSLLLVVSGYANAEREAELYDAAQGHLDNHEWRRAVEMFQQAAELNGRNADAALYWMAYSQNQMGQRDAALATLVNLQKRFPKSKWSNDSKALEQEVRQAAGQNIEPRDVADEDLKIMAVNALMHTDPERAFPILEKIISGTQPPKIKDKAIFVLSQSSSPRAAELLGRLARDGARPELQDKAIKYLGMMGGDKARSTLAEIYTSSADVKVKKSVLRSYMIHGDKDRLLTLAKGEQNPELRIEAVKQLGVMGARNELWDLYRTETSVDVKKKVIQGLFISGSADRLGELARAERDPELRATAIRNLGLLGGDKAAELLLSLYATDASADVKKAVINGLFLQGNSKALVNLARKEKDPSMKKQIVSKLSIMGSPEATEYLMEILNQ
jgi:HEAT repeat protein